MVEGVVQRFSPTGRITVDVLRTSRPREEGGTARARYAVPAHSVTVVPGAAGLRTGDGPGSTEPSPTPETLSSTSPVELLTVDCLQTRTLYDSQPAFGHSLGLATQPPNRTGCLPVR